jgi:signal peptidase I
MTNKKKKSIIREYIEAMVVAIVLALIIRTLVVQAFKIPSGSMLQTLQIGDHILVNKFIYTFTDPERGDIIVFKYPEDKTRDFIKRVIGLPGETIEVKNRVVYIDGKPIKENYAAYTATEFSSYNNLSPRLIPPDSYFMMGDNRDNSMDSRKWGFLKRDLIRGKAMILYFSIQPSAYKDSSFIKKFFNDIYRFPGRIRWNRLGKVVH